MEREWCRGHRLTACSFVLGDSMYMSCFKVFGKTPVGFMGSLIKLILNKIDWEKTLRAVNGKWAFFPAENGVCVASKIFFFFKNTLALQRINF